ncbi:hypothetical protein [Yinghuangia sp. YIM S10712]|uniref:hypothetical protein n=1 Tax=Yinghuangia sp. YIM S10712 TaxID=3436930 RepID=UPI003F538A7C
MEGTTRAATGRQGLHQIVYRWQHQDLFGHKGLGPAATSLSIAELARITPDLAEAVTAEFGGDGAPSASTSLLHVDSFAAAVHRAPTEFECGRLANHAHVLLGSRAELTPHVVLALDGWEWRHGQPQLGEIPVGRRLDRVPRAILDDALTARAFALRDAARRQADALTFLLAAVLRRPTASFSVRLADCGGDAVALLWGLFDLVTVPLPGPLTFSTYETDDETHRPRFVVVPRWPSQLPSGRHRVDPDTEARTDVFRDAAERMVARYVADDWDTMYPLLRGLQELRRIPPYDRAVEIRERFGAAEVFVVGAQPRLETPEVVPGESDEALTRASAPYDSRFAAEREADAAASRADARVDPEEPQVPNGPDAGPGAGEAPGEPAGSALGTPARTDSPSPPEAGAGAGAGLAAGAAQPLPRRTPGRGPRPGPRIPKRVSAEAAGSAGAASPAPPATGSAPTPPSEPPAQGAGRIPPPASGSRPEPAPDRADAVRSAAEQPVSRAPSQPSGQEIGRAPSAGTPRPVPIPARADADPATVEPPAPLPPAALDERPAPALTEPEAFPRSAAALPERPEEPPPSAGPADREAWKQRGVYDEDIDALEFATDQIATGGADRAVAFVEDVVALAVALELADVRLLPYIAEHLPRRLDDAPKWSHREREAVRHMLLHPVRYGDRLLGADVAPPVLRRLFERLVRVVLSLEKDPAGLLRILARELMSERRKLPPYPVLDDVLRRSSWEPAYHRELGRRWAELNPPWTGGP